MVSMYPLLLVVLAVPTVASAPQDPVGTVSRPATQNPAADPAGATDERQLSYPGGAETPVARINGDPLTLGQLIRHIDAMHSPGFAFAAFMEQDGQPYLSSPWAARWIRNFADATALRRWAESQGWDLSQLPPFVEAAKKAAFEAYLSDYAKSRAERGQDFNPTRKFIRDRLARFERERGLEAEVQGLLDMLINVERSKEECQAYYRDHTRSFGGVVEVAHILVHNRDPRTGLLLGDEGQKRAAARVAEIKASLAPDGSNFAEIARRYSDDRATAQRGGALGNVERFDAKLPAEFTLAAWSIPDGAVAGPIETPFGLHFIRRETLHLKGMILFNDALLPQIEKVMRMHEQEDLLLQVRDLLRVELLY